jgi:site-specific DNA recombinase
MGKTSRMRSSEGEEFGALRACAYLRVSTGRQAESDLSIPDQRKQVAAFCANKGWSLLTEYVEPGASAMDDNRPEFQRMIERATDDDHPFDVIVVHSFSRFFRDAFGLEMYIRRLAKAGVRLVSITQELGDDPAQVMMRQVIALFDEYQSRENAKHVLRAMNENARQGFYNGSPVPLGYRTEETEKRGAKVKKRLAVDPAESEAVRLIFRLYRHGDGQSGPLGLKRTVSWLNERGYPTRKGARFGVATVHKILTNSVYVGEWVFNKCEARTQRAKPVDQWITVEVPPIIERAEFDAVQATLKAHNPRVTAPRVVTGPVLLTGLATCASCEGAMTMRTGTSRSGQVHKYYACSTWLRKGKTACKGRTVRMDTLDNLVVEHLSKRLFTTERLVAILAAAFACRAEKAVEVDRRVVSLQREVTDAADKLKRLYRMVEEGIAELDDILTDRVASLKLDRERAQAALDRIQAQAAPPGEIPLAAIEQFGRVMRENIANGEIPLRKSYLRAVVDRIEVDDASIRIIGDGARLEQVIGGKSVSEAGVRSFGRKWRSLGESNPCFSLERAAS